MTAKSKIVDFILKHGYIENHYCIDNRITTRLGAVIFSLKNNGEGWDFAGEEIGEHHNYRYTATNIPSKYLKSEQGQYVLPLR